MEEEVIVIAWKWSRRKLRGDHEKENFPEGERNWQCWYCQENNNMKSEKCKNLICWHFITEIRWLLKEKVKAKSLTEDTRMFVCSWGSFRREGEHCDSEERGQAWSRKHLEKTRGNLWEKREKCPFEGIMDTSF